MHITKMKRKVDKRIPGHDKFFVEIPSVIDQYNDGRNKAPRYFKKTDKHIDFR